MSAVKRRVQDTQKQDEIVVNKAEEEEDLLPGWRKEVKVRKAGSAKKVDRFYTDPVTGYIFRSLKDVQRYLKTGELGKLAIKPKDNTRVTTDVEDKKLHSSSLVVKKSSVESTSTDSASSPSKKMVEVNLPEREEKSESKMVPSPLGETKRPLTRSKSSETSKSESHQRASKRLASDVPLPSSPEPKTRQATRQAGIKVDAPIPSPPEPKTRRATRVAGIKADVSPPSQPEPKTRQAARIAGIEVDASAPSQPEPKTREAGNKVDTSSSDLKTRVGASPPQPKTRQARRLAGMDIDASPPSLPDPQTRQATGMEIDASPVSLPERKTRQATRMAGIKTDSPPEPRTSRQAKSRRGREAESRSSVNLDEKIGEVNKSTLGGMQVECVGEMTNKHAGMDNMANRKQEILPPANREKINTGEKQKSIFSPATPSTPEKHYKENEKRPTTSTPVSVPAPKEQAPPADVPPGFQKDDKYHEKQGLINPSVSNPIPQQAESSMSFCLNDLWTDPCIEFAVKTLTGAIPFGDLNNYPGTQLEVPMEDLWTDPCIEFAVKTLTGAIPVGEDPCGQGYMQQQHRPSSCSESRAVHNFSLPDVGMNLCQTDVLSQQFETAAHNNSSNNNKQQQDGNGVLQTSGNFVFPQGNNGQCSRARFSD